MPFATLLRTRWAPVAILAVAAAVALICAVGAVSRVSLLPPKLAPRTLEAGGATTHVLIDLPKSKLADRSVSWEYFGTVSTRADLLARVMVSAPAREQIGRRAGIAADQIAAVAPVTAGVQSVLTEPGSEQRAHEIRLARRPYRIEAHSRPRHPIIDIYTQAPSPAEAERLGDAAITGLRDHLRALAIREGLDPANQVVLHQLGRARGAVITPGAKKKVAGLTFLVVFALVASLLLLLLRRARAGGRARPAPSAAAAPAGQIALSAAGPPGPVRVRWPAPAGDSALAFPLQPPRIRATLRSVATYGGDWPRTTRVLPWMLAAFMALLWLVPFDSIQLTASLPIDLKLDRLVLPFLFATWVLALAAGGRAAPTLRVTWIHFAVGAFVAFACLSVILNAASLSQALELEFSLKKLPLLLAYLSLFVMAASIVRRSEVRAFLEYILVLAVICSLGMIWEYRFSYNVFFDFAGKLPGIFEVQQMDTGYDLGGRRTTQGPTVHGLVAVSMLAMAMPIAVVGIMQAKRWRRRILYGLALCILFGAVMATQRKTAVVAPIAGVLTLAYFRRRELLKLAPVAVALLIVLAIVSPGTIAPVVEQFRPSTFGANTVSDRASDYDAIRPDVWTQLPFGRGYGSYQPLGHRILDSEVLVRTVEMGALGLAAFLLLGFSVVAVARETIGQRHPVWAPPALAGAAAAVVFVVVAALFDTLSFAQVPYIFLCFAALVAAVVKPGEDESSLSR